MEQLAKAMAPIFYSCIFELHTYTIDQIPAVYRPALDAYIAEKEAAKQK